MNQRPVRRVSAVLLVYALVAYALLPGADWLARVLALPPLFGVLVRTLFVLLAAVVAAVAWRYPNYGERPPGPSPEDRDSVS